jgi:hypothetical protein
MSDGQQVLWELLRGIDPEEVTDNAEVQYIPDRGEFRIPSFAETVIVSPAEQRITGDGPATRFLLESDEEHFRLGVIAYLAQAKGEPLTGDLVPPARTSGGKIYEEGAHRLPLDQLAKPYAHDKAGFLTLTDRLGGDTMEKGDASVKLFPLPLVPISFVLYERDDEFDEQMDIYFDTSSPGQFAPDVLWSIAEATVNLLIELREQ